MNWLSPIIAPRKHKRPPVIRRDGTAMPSTARESEIEGVTYESIYAAMKALDCSASKVYRLIGENWRYTKAAK